MFFKNRYIKSYGFLLIAALVFSVLFPGNRVSAEPAEPEGGSTLGGEYRRIQKLVDTEHPAADDQFGHSVSISGDLAVVGVPFADVSSNADQGRAYLYRRTGASWAFEAELTASDGAAGDRFGYSVDIDNGVVIIGAPNDDITDANGSLQDFGSVYIFKDDPLQDPEWVAAKLSNVRECYPSGMSCTPDPSTGEHFGFSVAIDGDKVVVGAPDDHNIDDSSSLRSGSASVYVLSGSWNLFGPKAKGSQGNAGFGTSVDISGDTVVVGTPGYSVPSPSITGAGRVSIYAPFPSAGTPVANQEFTGDSSSDEFGLSVAVDGLDLVFGGLGQAFTSKKGEDEEDPWATPVQLVAEDTPVNGYGHSVAIDNHMIVVGSEYSTNRAEAYVFRRLDNDWLHRAILQQDDVDQEDSDHFGVSVGISGNKIIVGADLEVLNSQNSRGSASIFRYIHKTSDFDGNGRSNISVIRPNAPYEWYWYLPENEGYTGTTFGTTGDVLAPADYDGDGTTDIAVYRPSDHTWYITESSTGDVTSPVYGASGDKPRPGDFDGDGKADLAVFRPANSTWYWTRSSDGEYGELQFGSSGDIPLLADRNGDGVTEITRFTPSTGVWRFYNLETQATETVSFGQNGDIPATGDFDGDLEFDPAVFRPSTGTWYRLDSTDGFYAIQFGASGDIPAVLDYDGDGKSDISLFRPSDGVWYIINSGYPDPTEDEYTFLQFGASGDTPAPATYQQ
jgi:hypothetical protein